MKKKKYQTPAIEVIDVESEGIMASSLPYVAPGGTALPSVNQTGLEDGIPHSSSFEDLINDILTFED